MDWFGWKVGQDGRFRVKIRKTSMVVIVSFTTSLARQSTVSSNAAPLY